MTPRTLGAGPLALNRMQLQNVDGLEGTLRKRGVRGNNGMKKVFEDTENEYRRCPFAQIYRLHALVRWSLCDMTRAEYSDSVGISANSSKVLESTWTGKAAISRRLMEQVCEHWNDVNIDPSIREQLIALLLQTDDGVNGLYRTMCYDVGQAEFIEQTRLTTHNLEWRRLCDVVPDFMEVRTAVHKIYPARNKLRPIRLEQATTVWSEDMSRKYKERTVEEPLAQFLIAWELHAAKHHNSKLTFELMCKQYGLSASNASELTHREFVPWDAVDDVACEVLDAESYENVCEQWGQCWEQRKLEPTFQNVFRRIQQEQGIADEDIRYALASNTTQYRATKTTKKLEIPTVDKNAVTTMLRDGFCAKAPARSCIAAIARTREEESMLIRLFRNQKKRRFQRKGTHMHGIGLEMRIDRDVNGVRREQVIDYCIEKGWYIEGERTSLIKLIGKLENAGAKTSEYTSHIKHFRRAIDALGDERRDATLHRKKQFNGRSKLPAHCQQFSTVHDAIHMMFEAEGSIEDILKVTRENCEAELRIGWKRLNQIAHGKNYAPLPQIQHVLNAYGLTMTEAALHDWYAVYPTHLCRKNSYMRDRPLDRMIQTMIAAVEPNMARFARNRMDLGEKNDGFEVSRILAKVRLTEDRAPWNDVEKILLALHLTPKDIPWKIAHELYRNGDDAEAALKAVEPEMRRRRIPKNHMTLPGFTHQEMGVPFRPYRD